MHFALTVDDNYMKYAGVLMTNLAMIHPHRHITIHLVTTGISDDNSRRLDEFVEKYGDMVTVELYDATDLLKLIPKSEKAPDRLNTIVFLRVMLSECLPEDVERVIYMDVDMVVLRPLDELWEIDLEDKFFAAMPQKPEPELDMFGNLSHGRAMGFKEGDYFNAGLMVQNLVKWRKEGFITQIIQCYLQNVGRFALLEEDTLNTLIGGNYVRLSGRYNEIQEANNPYLEYPEDTAILHFVNETKQWFKGCNPKVYELYLPYVKKSLWHDLELLEPTTVKAGYLAGKNAELQGDYKTAAKYYEMTASRLMEYYLHESKPIN